MRVNICLACSLVILMGSIAQANEAAARRIVEKAIDAAGGAAKLEKFAAHTFSEKGTFYGMGAAMPYTGKYAVQLPNKFRMEIQGVFVLTVNGDKGWNSQSGDMTKEQLKEQSIDLYAGYVSSLTPLKGDSFKLAMLGEKEVEGKPAVGVKVTKEGKPEVRLYFDKNTGLLVKNEYSKKVAELDNKNVLFEHWFKDYKEYAGGARFASSVVVKRDGEMFIEAEMADLKPAEKLDDKLFGQE